jgi:hypothetical protein
VRRHEQLCVVFRVVDGLVDWKQGARFCMDGHDRPFCLAAQSGQPPEPGGSRRKARGVDGESASRAIIVIARDEAPREGGYADRALQMLTAKAEGAPKGPTCSWRMLVV